MRISFDTENFKGRSAAGLLTNALANLRAAGSYTHSYSNTDVEDVVCKTPSAAYKFVRYVSKSGVSPAAERIFLKNPSIGVRYLKYVNRPSFIEEAVQKRFWKKVVKNPSLAFDYCSTFNKRLSEEEEEVFVKDMRVMRDYAQRVIKGKFPQKVHDMILLKSFESMDAWPKENLQRYMKFVEGIK